MSNTNDSILALLDTINPRPTEMLTRAIILIEGQPIVVYIPANGYWIPRQVDYKQQVETTSSAELATTSPTTDTSVEKEASPAIGAGENDGEENNSTAPSNTLEEESSSREQAIKEAFDEQNRLRIEQEAAFTNFTELKLEFGKTHPDTVAKWKESVDISEKWCKVVEKLGELTSQPEFDLNSAVRKWYPDNRKFARKDFWKCFEDCQQRYETNKKFYDASMAHSKTKNTSSAKAVSASNAQKPTSSEGAYLLALLKEPKAQPAVDADTSNKEKSQESVADATKEKGRWRKSVNATK